MADCNTGSNGERQGDLLLSTTRNVRGKGNSRQESTPKETELTTPKPLFLGNARSKDKVSFFL